MKGNGRLFRILAWIIDWNLSSVPALLFLLCNPDFARYPTLRNPALVLLFLLLVVSYPVIFVLRDVIFAGRSIGKRIFGLHVLDEKTGNAASVGQRILRNLFFSVYPVDGVILLVTQKSIGDHLANTRVVRK